jgi:hypothetical protein
MTCAIVDECYLQAIAAVITPDPDLLVSILLLSITLEDALAFVGNAPQACLPSKPFVLVVATCRPNRPLAFIRLAVQFTFQLLKDHVKIVQFGRRVMLLLLLQFCAQLHACVYVLPLDLLRAIAWSSMCRLSLCCRQLRSNACIANEIRIEETKE